MYRDATPFHGFCITMASSKAVPGVIVVGRCKQLWQLVNRNAPTFSRSNRKEVVHQFESKALNEPRVL
jgi:hypothetical protein